MMLKYLVTAAALSFVTVSANASECTPKLGAKAPIAVVGSYGNMRFTDEHAYGYTVQLWSSGSCLFGFLLSSGGLTGNTPTGLIENINYDGKTGAISFGARLSAGLIPSGSAATSPSVPSHDVYEFKGTLQKNSLDGTLRHVTKNDAHDASRVVSETAMLPLSIQASKEMQRYLTYSQWELMAKVVLKSRGPKW